MNKNPAKLKMIIALAYLHRYLWIVAIIICAVIRTKQSLCVLGVCSVIFSIWSLVGYKCKWKHIYCSYQNAYHQEMTPKSMQWDKIKKFDAYGVPLIAFVLGSLFIYISRLV